MTHQPLELAKRKIAALALLMRGVPVAPFDGAAARVYGPIHLASRERRRDALDKLIAIQSPSTRSIGSSQAMALAPLRLPPDLRLTPGQFERVCQANPEAVLELDAIGRLIVRMSTGGETSGRAGGCSTVRAASVCRMVPCSASIW